MDNLRSFFTTTPLHGCLIIYTSSRLSQRLFWIICLLLALTFCGYQIHQLIRDFTTKKVSTDISIVRGDQIYMPDILVCNHNSYNNSVLLERGFNLENMTDDTQELWYFLQDILSGNLGDLERVMLKGNETKVASQLKTLSEMQKFEGYEHINEFLYSFGLQCDRFFHKCKQKRKLIVNGTITYGNAPYDCCKKIQPVAINGFGICYLVPGSVWQKSDKATHSSYATLSAFLVHLGREWYDPTYTREGIYLTLTRNFSLMTDMTWITLAAGYNGLELSLTKTESVPTPTRKCKIGSMQGEAGCVRSCEAKFFTSKCGCLPPSFVENMLTEIPVMCNFRQLYFCLKFHLAISRTAIEKCKLKCEDNPPCITYKYGITISHLSYIPGLKNRNKSLDHDQFVEVLTFFPTFLYEEIKEFYAQTFEALLGGVGGLLGVWFGGSILAVIHLVWAVIEMCDDATSKRKDSKKKKKNDNKYHAVEDV